MRRKLPSPPSELPEGFVYQPEFLSTDEEAALLQEFERLNFEAFNFHGYKARRRIVSYGFDYDFGTRQTSPTQPIPGFLNPIRDRAAVLAGVAREEIVEAMVTEYAPGAPIGWHRDVWQFETIIGISLASACRMRLKPYRADGKLVSMILEPRSAYILSGDARWKYQHSIPPVEALRYSITFRTRRAKREPSARDDAA